MLLDVMQGGRERSAETAVLQLLRWATYVAASSTADKE